MTASVQNAASTASARRPTPKEDEARRAIAAAVETYRLGFLRLDPEQLASVWDRQYEPLVYIAQEKDEPIHGWAAIQLYLAALPEHVDRVLSKELEDVKIDVLGDAAIVFFTSRSSVMLKGRPTKYEPIGHISMIFHRAPEGWRAIHFHESARSEQATQVAQAMKALHGKLTRP